MPLGSNISILDWMAGLTGAVLVSESEPDSESESDPDPDEAASSGMMSSAGSTITTGTRESVVDVGAKFLVTFSLKFVAGMEKNDDGGEGGGEGGREGAGGGLGGGSVV